MAFGKRQLVLASLVVALGAAVYLNWQFAGNDDLLATNALNSEPSYGAAQLVNASAQSSASSASDDAVSASAEADTYFTEARLNRQKSRDEATELMEKTLSDASATEEAKKEAVTQAAAISENILQENNIENLIKAKGFEDCMAFVQNGECNVVVKTGKLLDSDAVALQEIVVGQTGLAYDKIKIVEVN